MSKPRTERDRQREETRRRLHEATLRLVRRDGLDGARIDEIAALAGVSRAAFYFHYRSKDDVLAERLDESERSVAAALDALPDDAPIARVLDAAAVAIARDWQDDPELLRAVGAVALKRTASGLPDAVDDHAVHRALRPRFHRAHARGELGDLVPPELLATFFLVNLFGAGLAWCSDPSPPLEGVLRGVVAFFVRGIA